MHFIQSVAERSPNEVRAERSEVILSWPCPAPPVFTRVVGDPNAPISWVLATKILQSSNILHREGKTRPFLGFGDQKIAVPLSAMLWIFHSRFWRL